MTAVHVQVMFPGLPLELRIIIIGSMIGADRDERNGGWPQFMVAKMWADACWAHRVVWKACVRALPAALEWTAGSSDMRPLLKQARKGFEPPALRTA